MQAPLWVTAFLDSPADDWDASREFWTAVTGYRLSAARGEHGDFQTLLPPEGDAYLRVQRLHEGAPRIHLDLHVPDLRESADRAVALGAVEVAAQGHIVMASPGGLPFCFVAAGESRRPAAATWTAPGGATHRSRVDQVALDIPAEHWPAEVAFWAALTGWPARERSDSEFAPLHRPTGQPIRLLPQRLGDRPGRCAATWTCRAPTERPRRRATSVWAPSWWARERAGRCCSRPTGAGTASPTASRTPRSRPRRPAPARLPDRGRCPATRAQRRPRAPCPPTRR